MKFTPDEAKSLVLEFADGLDDHQFCQSHLVKDGNRYAVSSIEPRKALELLVAMVRASGRRSDPPVLFPEEGSVLLKDWITAWISPEGWTRMLAARRQRKVKAKRRHGSNKVTPVAAPDMAAYYLSELAQSAGVNRSAFLGKLVHHLRWEDEGQAFMKRFNLKLLTAQRNEGRELLIEAFECTPGHFEHVVEQILVDGFERHDLAVQTAQKVGKAKLAKLAVMAKKLASDNALRFALFPQDQLAGRSPLVAFSEGESLTVLKTTTPA